MTKEEVIEIIRQDKDILPVREINGYTARTVFSKRDKTGEVNINVLLVYKDKEVVQVSVDAVNLFGTLLTTKAFHFSDGEVYETADLSPVAERVVSWL